MAINLDDRYPGRANPKTLNYPQGSFKNRTSPTSKDGTYLEQDWANDMLGFFQAMMKKAGLTANGDVDTAQASQYLDALIQTMRSTHATETEYGSGRLATTAEAQALVSDATLITPAKLAAAFGGSNQVLSSPGLQKFPGGLIVQTITLSNTNNEGVGFSSASLPVAFPNGITGITASTRTTGPSYVPYHVSVVNISPNTIGWIVYEMDGTPVSTTETVSTDFVIFGY